MSTRAWITNREDPRTIFLFCLVVLAAGCVITPFFISQGGASQIFGIVWLMGSAGQAVWATWNLCKFHAAPRRGTSPHPAEGPQEPGA